MQELGLAGARATPRPPRGPFSGASFERVRLERLRLLRPHRHVADQQPRNQLLDRPSQQQARSDQQQQQQQKKQQPPSLQHKSSPLPLRPLGPPFLRRRALSKAFHQPAAQSRLNKASSHPNTTSQLLQLALPAPPACGPLPYLLWPLSRASLLPLPCPWPLPPLFSWLTRALRLPAPACSIPARPSRQSIFGGSTHLLARHAAPVPPPRPRGPPALGGLLHHPALAAGRDAVSLCAEICARASSACVGESGPAWRSRPRAPHPAARVLTPSLPTLRPCQTRPDHLSRYRLAARACHRRRVQVQQGLQLRRRAHGIVHDCARLGRQEVRAHAGPEPPSSTAS